MQIWQGEVCSYLEDEDGEGDEEREVKWNCWGKNAKGFLYVVTVAMNSWKLEGGFRKSPFSLLLTLERKWKGLHKRGLMGADGGINNDNCD